MMMSIKKESPIHFRVSQVFDFRVAQVLNFRVAQVIDLGLLDDDGHSKSAF